MIQLYETNDCLDFKTLGNKLNSKSDTNHNHNSAYASKATASSSVNGLMSTTDKLKLDGIANNANNYVHPNDANNRHVTDNEKSTWNGKANNSVATTSANGLMTGVDKAKLDGIATGANNYVHPSTHPASVITQDASNRFVSDSEKTKWNGKAEGNHNHTYASITDKPKTIGIIDDLVLTSVNGTKYLIGVTKNGALTTTVTSITSKRTKAILKNQNGDYFIVGVENDGRLTVTTTSDRTEMVIYLQASLPDGVIFRLGAVTEGSVNRLVTSTINAGLIEDDGVFTNLTWSSRKISNVLEEFKNNFIPDIKLAEDGYFKFPATMGGLIIQWKNVSISLNNEVYKLESVRLPKSLTQKSFCNLISIKNATDGGYTEYVSSITPSNDNSILHAEVRRHKDMRATGTVQCYVLSIGK